MNGSTHKIKKGESAAATETIASDCPQSIPVCARPKSDLLRRRDVALLYPPIYRPLRTSLPFSAGTVPGCRVLHDLSYGLAHHYYEEGSCFATRVVVEKLVTPLCAAACIGGTGATNQVLVGTVDDRVD
jgi:hypothetical protein